MQSASPQTGYRPDIDGLRAIAVLSVVLYHAGVSAISGGFVGVDVFFVVSGFLITSIILDDVRNGRFSIAQFYERRVRRIFPALYLTIAITLLGGFALFSATDLERLLQSLAWLSFFASNFYFAENSGYFDAAAEQSATLHTWSLAIEEQFYVLFPLLVAVLLRRSPSRTKWIVFALAVASLAFSIYVVDRDARPAFFSTLARVWELMIGALAALGFYPRIDDQNTRKVVAYLGLASIAASLVLLTADTPFPGLYALPACAGTAAVIWTGTCGSTPVVRLLSWRPLVAIGLISYSLYLLHWPLLVFARYWAQGELSPALTIAAVALAFAGAWLSWRFVETPFRRQSITPIPRMTLFAGALALMLGLCVAGFAGAAYQANRYSIAEQVIEREKARALAEPCLLRDTQTFDEWPQSTCFRAAARPAIAVWGDSFAGHYFEAFRSLADRSGRTLYLLGASSCPPIAGLKVPNRPGCAPFNEGALALIQRERPAIVVLSADWMIYEKKKTVAEMFDDKFELLSATIDRLRAAGSQVVVIGPSPMFPAPVAQIAEANASHPDGETAKASYSRKFDAYFRRLAAENKIEYFATYEMFCDSAMICRYRQDNELLFWDTGHLTARGGAYVLNRLVEKIPALTQVAP